MNKDYQELLTFVLRSGELVAENILELGTDKESLTLDFRDKFAAVEDKLRDNKPLEHQDYLYLYTAAITAKEVIKKNARKYAAVVEEYEKNLIPKLKIVAEQTDEEKRQELIEDFFG